MVHALETGTRRRERTPFGALAAVCERIVERTEVLSWPSPRYQRDPVGFAVEVLGVSMTEALRNFLEALRDNRKVTWRSGHKTGKTTGFAIAALWFWCSFERACVPLTAVKEEQISFGVFKEIRRLCRNATVPMGVDPHLSCRAGLHDTVDDRKIWGLVAQSSEGVQGISGPNVLVLCDEASGIPDGVLEAIGTSCAGSGGLTRIAYAGNPTRTIGGFYRSHHQEKSQWKTLHTSSEDTPNARGATGDDVIPGLAGPEWIAEWKASPGEDSPEYAIRVKGNFHSGFEGKIVSPELWTMAEAVWDATPFVGQLQIGVDPAGDRSEGDSTAMAVRRGMKVITVIQWRGLTTDAIVENVHGFLAQYRTAHEPTPRICVDCEGVIGRDVEVALRAYLLRNPEAFELVVFRGSKKLLSRSSKYDMRRDEGYGHLRDWLDAGGAVPTDLMLQQDSTVADFRVVIGSDRRERLAATSKKDLKKLLGRSPDKGDALILSTFGFAEVATAADDNEAGAASPTAPAKGATNLDDDDTSPYDDRGRAMNPYAGAG